MPIDAKLGLVLGVGLVISVAVMFFHKDGTAADPAEASVNSAGSPAVKTKPPANGSTKRPVKGKPTAHGGTEEDAGIGEAANDDGSLPTSTGLQPTGGVVVPDLVPVPRD